MPKGVLVFCKLAIFELVVITVFFNIGSWDLFWNGHESAYLYFNNDTKEVKRILHSATKILHGA